MKNKLILLFFVIFYTHIPLQPSFQFNTHASINKEQYFSLLGGVITLGAGIVFAIYKLFQVEKKVNYIVYSIEKISNNVIEFEKQAKSLTNELDQVKALIDSITAGTAQKNMKVYHDLLDAQQKVHIQLNKLINEHVMLLNSFDQAFEKNNANIFVNIASSLQNNQVEFMRELARARIMINDLHQEMKCNQNDKRYEAIMSLFHKSKIEKLHDEISSLDRKLDILMHSYRR